MSRKARTVAVLSAEDIQTPKIWLANRGYSEYKTDLKTGRLRDVIVVLYHKSYCKNTILFDQHPLITLGSILGRLLTQSEQLNMKNLCMVDITSLIPEDKYDEYMDEEGASINLEKKISKPCCRVLEKMLLHKATVVAFGSCCQLLLKIIPTSSTISDLGHRLTSENVSRLIFINPVLSPRCINAQFKGTPSTFSSNVKTDLIFLSHNEKEKRQPIIRFFFPIGESLVKIPISFADSLISVLSQVKSSTTSNSNSGLEKEENFITKSSDLEATNTIGETIWLAEVKIEMNRNSKQYEQVATDMTRDLNEQFVDNLKKARKLLSKSINAADDIKNKNTSLSDIKNININSTNDEISKEKGKRIGGLVLRGNRCVLVRSLENKWNGMRIPYVSAKSGETVEETAIRAVSELCDIDSDEFYILPALLPVTLYCPQGIQEEQGDVTVYLMYAVQPPPDGSLEDQDREEEDDLYDWYTYQRAIDVFKKINDNNSVLTMRTIACALASASSIIGANNIPRKWGGIFGQEWLQSIENGGGSTGGSNGTLKNGETKGKEFKQLPVMIMTGDFGAGKTTIIQHILANQTTCLRIAVIVNTIADVSMDSAVLQQSSKSEDENCKDNAADLFVVEICNCCICCSTAEEIVKEVHGIVELGVYDYCIVEASATIDLSSLTNNLNGCSSSSFYIDTTIAVVDAVTCLSAFKRMNAKIDPRSHMKAMESIVYSQLKTAEMIVINRCDQLNIGASIANNNDNTNQNILIIKSALRKLNSKAQIIDCVQGTIDPSLLMYTHSYQPPPPQILEKSVEVKEVNLSSLSVSTFTFRSYRPFHPARLEAAMRNMSSACENNYSNSSSNNNSGSDLNNNSNNNNNSSSNNDNNRVSQLNSSVIRISGYTWLANYPDNQGLLSYTRGHLCECKLGTSWWAAIDKKLWPVGLEEAIKPLWKEPYGDRQIELVLICIFPDSNIRKELENLLFSCLLSDEEFNGGQDEWNLYDDPFSFSWE